jgi:two-component system, NtrC family, response regulator HydG
LLLSERMNRILILEPDEVFRQQLSQWVQADGYAAAAAPSVSAAVASQGPLNEAAAVIVNESLAPNLLAAGISIPVLVLAECATVPAAVSAIKAGATNYLVRPQSAAELLQPLREAIAEQSADPVHAFSIGGNSPPMQALLEHVRKVAPTESTVLISGESGTGKELIARALHAASRRHKAALISVNCAAIPTHLIQTELFGHEGDTHRGLLEAAAGGTLFIDEIGELPLETQGQLLQVIAANSANIRLIAATQRDLEVLINNNQFRRDLYHRLNVVSLLIPPLRERGEDILLLADEILARTCRRLGKPAAHFNADARQALASYHWPGNVRELENAIERAVILGEGEITTSLLAIDASRAKAEPASATAPEQTMEDYFVSFVTAHQDQLTETELAERLGISRKSLWERRQRLNIPRKKTRKRGPRRDIR